MFEKIARTLRLGRWRHFAGSDDVVDLGNRYFELPNGPHGLSRRTVDYRVKREWSDYQFHSIPVQWNAWMRKTRQLPPTMEELQKDHARQERLRVNVAELDRAYREEKAALQAEVERVGQIDQPRRKPAPYPSHENPAIVPTISSDTGHPPSQEFGANVPKSVPDENTFPSMAQDSPERHQMAAALDEAADIKLGKAEKERQVKEGRVEQTKRGEESTRYADAPATPNDTFVPEEWKPVSRRR